MIEIEPSNLTIVIPTINSESYIDLILQYYLQFKINVITFVDSRTIDKTAAIAERFVPVRHFDNSAVYVEEVMESISTTFDSEFVLRMDDDELPSIGMLEFVAEVARHHNANIYGFPRYQCAVSKQGALLKHLDHDAKTHHRQWRLYCPSEVTFTKSIHTPGVELAPSQCVPAPDEACMIHLDWALHSYEQRKRKISQYDAHKAGAGSFFRGYYLYEEVDGAKDRFNPLSLPEFSSVAKNIAERFPNLCL